jgi:hypothetical protein
MMSNLKTVSMDSQVEVRPKYFEVYGKEIANGNRAWFLAFLMSFVALAAVVFAVLVKTQPPTVIRIAPDGEATVVGRPTKGGGLTTADSGTDPFLNQAFLKRFLRTYLNYAPANVDDRWATSLNMMTRNLRAATYKQMKDDNAFGKVVDDQIQSVRRRGSDQSISIEERSDLHPPCLQGGGGDAGRISDIGKAAHSQVGP